MNKNLKQIAVPLVSVLLGLVLGAIIMWAFSYDALWGYELLFKKAFGSIKSWGNISRAMGPLILVALGFSVASPASLTLDFLVRLLQDGSWRLGLPFPSQICLAY